LHLSELCPPCVGKISGGSDPIITGITCYSREVIPGFLFVALLGSKQDGAVFVSDAAAKGASAILALDGITLPDNAANLPIVSSPNPRRSFAISASRYFAAQPKTTAAVTGTNGKTSVAWFTKQLWSKLGKKSASIGTLGLLTDTEAHSLGKGLTTEDPMTLHRNLDALAKKQFECTILEASSHGLDQHRLDGVRFSAGAFTNLSHEHLDYHKNFDNYRTAKRRLFSELLDKDMGAVLNADTEEFTNWSDLARSRSLNLISFGRHGKDLKLLNSAPCYSGQHLKFEAWGTEYNRHIPVFGEFQAENILCALGLVVACGETPEAAIEATEALSPPPGRLELVARILNGSSIFVDFAHTPQALSTVLRELRSQTSGKIILVFGCGGERDQEKRPQMGLIADRMADEIIITDDNPRNEKASSIRKDILSNCQRAGEISDRAEAIKAAISMLTPNDSLLIAGKGHESGQIVGDTILPFNDRKIALNLLKELRGQA